MYLCIYTCRTLNKNKKKYEKMDDDSSKIAQSLFPMENCHLQVPDDVYNLFHAMDRELYTRLIHALGRDPAESVQVMAFWMWLERESKDMNFIKRILSLPLALLNDVVEETVVCWRCVESDRFMFAGEIVNGGNEILTLLPEILNNRINVSLRLLYENRIAVARAVMKIINTVCARALGDILRRAWRVNAVLASAADGTGRGLATAALYHSRESHLNVPFVPLPHMAAEVAVDLLHMPPPARNVMPPIHLLEAAAAGSFPAYDSQSQMLSNELGDLLGRNLSINNRPPEGVINGDGKLEVPADDRTVFLTFSKGYPITEDEVTEFFTRRFGDFIEDLIMQEVGEDEQVLYARMVARSTAVMEVIVGGDKAKYIINGKHVWARKYVKKNHQIQLPRWPTADQSSASSPTSFGVYEE